MTEAEQGRAERSSVDTGETGETQTGTCESCGSPDEELTVVRRVYVTPEAWDTEEKVEESPDLERWCVVCRTHYPHLEE